MLREHGCGDAASQRPAPGRQPDEAVPSARTGDVDQPARAEPVQLGLVERTLERRVELERFVEAQPEHQPLARAGLVVERFDLAAMRNELDAALQTTTEMLSQATRLLALVSAPTLESAMVRHVEVLVLQPRVVMVVVITTTGGVTKRLFETEDPVDSGLAGWAKEFLNERVAGTRLGTSTLRRQLDDPQLSARERVFLERIRPAFVELLADSGTQLYVGSAAGLLGDARAAEELEACHRLLELLERRAAVIDLLSEALDPRRPVVRVGPAIEGAEFHDVSYVGAPYGLTNRTLGTVGLLGPLRMDYETAIRSVRAAAFELSRLVEDVYEEA